MDLRSVTAVQAATLPALVALHEAQALAAAMPGAEDPQARADAAPAPPTEAVKVDALASRRAEAGLPSVPGTARADAPEAARSVALPAVPLPAGRAADVVGVPAHVSTLLAEAPREPQRRVPADRRETARRRNGTASARAERDDVDHDDDDDGAGEGGRDADPAPTPPTRPLRRDASGAYRALVKILEAAGQGDALRELARGRRLWIVGPRPATPRDDLELVLLWADARGMGRVQRYRARGRRAAGDADTPGWGAWRVHRDVSAHGEALLVAGRALPAALRAAKAPRPLLLRLAPGRRSAPLCDAATAWIDLLDAQRLLFDLGEQWSVLLVWAPDALDAAAAAPPVGAATA